jgi:HPt (histidine-containing phosphotransfer) domain-containing protein
MLDQQDLDAVRALQRPGRPDILHQLLRTYLANSPTLVAQIQTAYAEVDFTVMQQSAHSLKSSSRALGARHLSDLCQQLEAASREQAEADCAALVPAIDAEFAAVVREMHDLLPAV